jgi:hypothetical protein
MDEISNNCSEFKDMSCEVSNFHTNFSNNDMVSEGKNELNMFLKGLPDQSGIFSLSPPKSY